ncbi:flagellar motor protein MotB [Helicobacter pametensis]|uniref:flagellar motor protein MotB n=1 Tax=Helicobacter pametensis TaxID=95149 RepID=UPI0004822C42|nr:flagellar motor protein MotB [Helicobacter pametensis]
MAKKKKCPECPAGEKWAVPYADFLSLLLALFIALYAISAQNTEKIKALKEEFVKIFDYAPKPEQAQPILPIAPNPEDGLEDMREQQDGGDIFKQQSEESLAGKIQQGGILEQVEEGVVLKLPTNILFPINSDKLEDKDSLLFLQRIVEIIKRLPQGIRIDIRGFANNPNITKTPYKTDYELASARALFVMNTLIQKGINPQQIFFSSQGRFGKPIEAKNEEERLAKTNRVEIYFFVSEQQSQQAKNLLKGM